MTEDLEPLKIGIPLHWPPVKNRIQEYAWGPGEPNTFACTACGREPEVCNCHERSTTE